jgi:hypothetical protein
MAFAPPRRDLEPVSTSAEVTLLLLDEIKGVFKGDPYEFLDGTVGNLLGISRGMVLTCVYAGLLGVLWYQIPNLPTFALAWVVGTMPIWLLPTAVVCGWKAWRWYVQSAFLASKKGVLLEVKMPRELVKSPRGMDVALSQLWMNMGEVTFMNRSWNGSVRPFFSFELASLGGRVHFFIWCWASHRHVVEAIIYAQYPEVEIVEAEDYATKFQYDPEKNFAACLDLRYEPKNDAYMIKSYVDFELDKDPKEEYKIDPLAQVLESLSSLKPHEQAWISIIITMNKDMRRKPHGKWWEFESRWKGLLLEEIDHIRFESLGGDIEEERWRSFVRIQQYRQTEQIRAIDRNLSKHPFNVGIHVAYITEPADAFDYPTFVRIREIYHPFGNPGWGNYLRYRRWHVPFDYPYQDLWELRWQLHTRRFLDCYRRRAHFYAPYQLPHNMMSTETIASIWHPASSGIKAPGLERIPSKKAEPPPNLPK